MEPLKATLRGDDPSTCVPNLELNMCDVEVSLGDACDDAGYLEAVLFVFLARESQYLHVFICSSFDGFRWV